jgi:hypothetical protein
VGSISCTKVHIVFLFENPEDNIQDNRQEQAQHERGDQREEKSEPALLNGDVPGQTPDEWDFTPENKNQPEDDQENTGDDEYFPETFKHQFNYSNKRRLRLEHQRSRDIPRLCAQTENCGRISIH